MYQITGHFLQQLSRHFALAHNCELYVGNNGSAKIIAEVIKHQLAVMSHEPIKTCESISQVTTELSVDIKEQVKSSSKPVEYIYWETMNGPKRKIIHQINMAKNKKKKLESLDVVIFQSWRNDNPHRFTSLTTFGMHLHEHNDP